ncbi:MAG: hypothetical protein Q8Q33_05735 [Chlamydiota bacterium]|nr:hypothetical protein [Chlamydiota bacterium]
MRILNKFEQSGFVLMQVIAAVGCMTILALIISVSVRVYGRHVLRDIADVQRIYIRNALVQEAAQLISKNQLRLKDGVFRMNSPYLMEEFSDIYCLIFDEEGKVNINAFWNQDVQKREQSRKLAMDILNRLGVARDRVRKFYNRFPIGYQFETLEGMYYFLRLDQSAIKECDKHFTTFSSGNIHINNASELIKEIYHRTPSELADQNLRYLSIWIYDHDTCLLKCVLENHSEQVRVIRWRTFS